MSFCVNIPSLPTFTAKHVTLEYTDKKFLYLFSCLKFLIGSLLFIKAYVVGSLFQNDFFFLFAVEHLIVAPKPFVFTLYLDCKNFMFYNPKLYTCFRIFYERLILFLCVIRKSKFDFFFSSQEINKLALYFNLVWV